MPARSKVEPFDTLLGQVPDGQVAELARVTPSAVRLRRLKLGIPAYVQGTDVDLAALDPLLGSMPDGQVADQFGIGIGVVRARRIALGIEAAPRPSEITYFDNLLGELSDELLAILAGVSKQAVTARRRRRGIASHRDQQRRCQAEEAD